MGLNLSVILREAAAEAPDKTAVIFDGFRLDYRQLEDLAGQVAAGLRAAGVGRGDKVALMLPNVPQFLAAYFGILTAGAVVVPLNVLLRKGEVAYHLRDSDSRCLIAWEDFAPEALAGAEAAGKIPVYVVGRPASSAPPVGSRSFKELMGEARLEMEETGPDETAVILYTSGTTGRPKGAELTHFNMLFNCRTIGDLFGTSGDDVAMAVLPLFHSFGQTCVMNATVARAGTLTLVPRFEAGRVLEVIERDRVTLFAGVPTMFYALLNHPDAGAREVSCLRLCGSGGASLPAEVLRAFEERFKVPILEGYGLSETSPVATFNVSVGERRVLSIGKRIWGVELAVLDEEGGRLPPGRDHLGEIAIRGHNVMKGYYKNPAATREAMRGGWFHTGDLGYVDEEGYFFIVDRKTDMILRGGFNVYPREVEEVLFEHPAVAEAAVIGVPDERLGEEVRAVVALKPGHDASAGELIAFCKERMAAFKHPRSVEFRETLPKGPTGKVLKKELREPPAARGGPDSGPPAR
ncbi:MAG: long-chain-fatty-acid--CoA ligase [Candidatus Dormibacterales bacterium]